MGAGPLGSDGSGTPDPKGHARVTPTGTAVVDRGAVGGARATVPNPSHPVGATRASPIRAARRGNPPPRCPHAVEHPSPPPLSRHPLSRAARERGPGGEGGARVRRPSVWERVWFSGPDGPAGSGVSDPYGDGKRRLQVDDGSGTVPERPRPFLSSGLDRVRCSATPSGAGFIPADPHRADRSLCAWLLVLPLSRVRAMRAEVLWLVG
ncbi:hypothetical protein HRbin27_00561 [bacterium HR27]|nr:hypothetical protein HRbin27_00561 [bacterium HR27]